MLHINYLDISFYISKCMKMYTQIELYANHGTYYNKQSKEDYIKVSF